MPDKAAHLAVAQRNQTVLDYLLQNPDACSEWVVTVAFYKALHLVEALFFHDGQGHGVNHENRDHLLKTNRRYSHIYKHYRPLWAASVVARYLEDACGKGYSCFSDFIKPDRIQSEFLNHRLHQIESSVHKLLGSA